MSRQPTWHRRVARYGLPAVAVSGVFGLHVTAAVATVFCLFLAVAYARDFMLHDAQSDLGCVCQWRDARFIANPGCPHHGPKWPFYRPPPPRGIALKAVLMVSSATFGAVLLLLVLGGVL